DACLVSTRPRPYFDTPPAEAGRFSVPRRGLRHGSPKGLPGPLSVPGRVLVVVEHQPAVRVRADVGAHRYALAHAPPPQPLQSWLVSAGGTATTRRPAYAALAARMARNCAQLASAMLFAREWFRTRLATCKSSREIVSCRSTRASAVLWWKLRRC